MALGLLFRVDQLPGGLGGMEYPQAKGRGGVWPVGPPRRKFSEFSALNHAFTLSVDFECRPMKMLMH